MQNFLPQSHGTRHNNDRQQLNSASACHDLQQADSRNAELISAHTPSAEDTPRTASTLAKFLCPEFVQCPGLPSLECKSQNVGQTLQRSHRPPSELLPLMATLFCTFTLRCIGSGSPAAPHADAQALQAVQTQSSRSCVNFRDNLLCSFTSRSFGSTLAHVRHADAQILHGFQLASEQLPLRQLSLCFTIHSFGTKLSLLETLKPSSKNTKTFVWRNKTIGGQCTRSATTHVSIALWKLHNRELRTVS